MSSAEKKDILMSQKLEALSVFMSELEKMLGEMGGSIMHDTITYQLCRSYSKEFQLHDQGTFIFSLSLNFDVNLLCEYAAQAKGAQS